MELELTGKTAVVTGAGRGIGLAIAEALTAEGVQVVGASRNVTPELEKASVAAVSADLSTPEGVTSLIDTALRELGGIDILVNNVGGGDADRLGLGGFLDTSDEQWKTLFDLNFFSQVWTTRAALPSLLERRGSIVNISSINAQLPGAGPFGYSEAKAALTALSKHLSEELGPQGVRSTPSPPVSSGARCGGPPPASARNSPRHRGSPTRICWQASGRASASPRSASPSPRRWPRWSPSSSRTGPPISSARIS